MKYAVLILLCCLCLGLLGCSPASVKRPKFIIAILDEPSSMNSKNLEDGKHFMADRILPLLKGGDKFGLITISNNSFSCPDSNRLFPLLPSPFYLDWYTDSVNAITKQRAHQAVMSVHIRPDLTASDILGSLAKAGTFFGEDTVSDKTLYLISDVEENVWRKEIIQKIRLTGVRVYVLFASHRFKGIKDDFLAFQAKKKYWEDLLHSTGTANSFIWDDDISRMKMDWLVEQLEQN